MRLVLVRKIFKKEIITPGVQIGKRNYDQKRSMEAKKVKSDWLVIGRAITSGNIKKNIQNLAKELNNENKDLWFKSNQRCSIMY